MSLHSEVIKIVGTTAPKSTTDKHKRAKQIESGIHKTQQKHELHKWVLSCYLYQMKKHNLYNYLSGKIYSRSAFYDELGLPQSTARYYETLWEFYIEKHGLTVDNVMSADTHKLQRAVAFIKDKDTKDVRHTVELAERGRMSRDEFIDELKQLYGIQQ